MIERQLLTEMGFEKLKTKEGITSNWKHEVWTYDWIFFVHYDGFPLYPTSRDINGDTASLKDFFRSFIREIRYETRQQ